MITTPQTEGDPDVAPVRKLVARNGRDTSWEAAAAQTNGKVAQLQRLIYDHLRRYGAKTDDQLRRHFTRLSIPHSRSGVSARRVELERAGWVRPTGQKRLSDAGMPMHVWEAVPEGTPFDGDDAPRRTHRTTVTQARQDAAADAMDELIRHVFLGRAAAAIVARAGEYRSGERKA